MDADQVSLVGRGQQKVGRDQQTFRNTHCVQKCVGFPACVIIFNHQNKPGRASPHFIGKEVNVPGVAGSTKYGCKADPPSLPKIPSNSELAKFSVSDLEKIT